MATVEALQSLDTKMAEALKPANLGIEVLKEELKEAEAEKTKMEVGWTTRMDEIKRAQEEKMEENKRALLEAVNAQLEQAKGVVDQAMGKMMSMGQKAEKTTEGTDECVGGKKGKGGRRKLGNIYPIEEFAAKAVPRGNRQFLGMAR